MFSKILIANRGEIAVRIIRACKEMGIKSVAVYSEADKNTLHTALADESYCIGSAMAADSYLDEKSIISAALISGAQAIHPGYGFLSENMHFAELCRKNGIAFIGPDTECMRKASDKTNIKKILAETNLNPIPGTDALETIEDALIHAEQIGYPIMLKACYGGGGRGLRIVSSPEELKSAYAIATAESQNSFGNSNVYIEKYIHPARHIEVQVLADENSNVISLGERDCSIQYHNQKLIEESPCPVLNSRQRKVLLSDAADAVKVLGYTGVGTLEFLMDKYGNLWFMEMNVRIQVEHGVSEMLTGIDLVKWQIRTAAGIALPFDQDSVSLDGVSIECRINALSAGKVKSLHIPGGPFVRFDSWLVPDTEITPYYDSLLGKLIVFAGTREEAVRKMKSALCELVITGIKTNIEDQLDIISDPLFESGNYDLTFIESR